MNWILFPSTGDPFVVSDGHTRLHQIAASEDGRLTQQTDVVGFTDAEWVTAFPDRAVCAESLSIPVTFPECASLQEAAVQRFQIPASCPKGGALYGHYLGEGVFYPQTWRESITSKRTGVLNQFTFNFGAVNPQVFSGYTDESGALYTSDAPTPYSPG